MENGSVQVYPSTLGLLQGHGNMKCPEDDHLILRESKAKCPRMTEENARCTHIRPLFRKNISETTKVPNTCAVPEKVPVLLRCP